MELSKVMHTRRSVREYINKPVEQEKLREVISAAQLAPSWKNSQVSRYYVVTGEEKLAEVKYALSPYNQKNMADAPALIVTAIVLNRSGYEKDGTPTNELGNGWGFYDCGLQSMNLLLKATELGLSTLVMGIRDNEKIKKILGIPETEAVVSVIGVGYSNAEPAMPKRKEIDDIAKFF
ncbi:nitroreductase family protein [uncultured Ruminococcus sp.]|uniref:nitroreductase family protein n=1 Tax=uncultured Ruminococcus sp. TaxID=165186 RepID=UPI0025CF3F15|nr:nitroreductase family protein [uncultured Ruminococcus sp.]